uniref:Uncharacterized protein n=1 Tax=Nothobranchius kadleci TaxID=1051664 RepID=A0A1A8CXY3_NOTKA
MGETGRTCDTRRKEHQKETRERLTRTTKKKAEEQTLKSAISDHRITDRDQGKTINTEEQLIKTRHTNTCDTSEEDRRRCSKQVKVTRNTFMSEAIRALFNI